MATFGKIFKLNLLILILVLTSSSVLAGECKMTILHLNDLHGYLNAPEKKLGGADRIAALVGKISAENASVGRHTILLVGGDALSGTPVSEYYKGEAEFKFLESIGTSAMVIGNHEFDYGIEALKKNMQRVGFPTLSANIIDGGATPLFASSTYVIPLSDGCRVGIIGLSHPGTATMTKAGNVGGLRLEDPIKAASNYMDDLIEQSEIQVALTHLGVKKDTELANKVNEIDLVVGGHDHIQPEEYCRATEKTPICQTPPKGQYLGRIDLSISNGKVLIEGTQLIPVNKKAGKPAKEIQELINKYLGPVETSMGEVVGNTNETLFHRPPKGTFSSTPLAQLITDSIKKATKSNIAFINMGSIRKDIKKGKITLGDVFQTLPFSDSVGTIELTGQEIITLIGLSEKLAPEKITPFLCWSGIDYTKRNDSYTVNVNGKPLENSAIYKAATIDFLATGGDGYSLLKNKKFNDTGKKSRDIFADYLKNS